MRGPGAVVVAGGVDVVTAQHSLLIFITAFFLCFVWFLCFVSQCLPSTEEESRTRRLLGSPAGVVVCGGPQLTVIDALEPAEPSQA